MVLTINPCKHDVGMVVPADHREGQDGQPTHEHSSLAEVLPRDPALRRVVQHQGAENHATQGPGQPQVHLEQHGGLPQALGLRLICQVEDGRVDTEGADTCRDQQNADGLALERAEVEEGDLVLHLVLVLDLALLVLDVEDGAALRVVEGGGAVEGAQDEGGGHCYGYHL